MVQDVGSVGRGGTDARSRTQLLAAGLLQLGPEGAVVYKAEVAPRIAISNWALDLCQQLLECLQGQGVGVAWNKRVRVYSQYQDYSRTAGGAVSGSGRPTRGPTLRGRQIAAGLHTAGRG